MVSRQGWLDGVLFMVSRDEVFNRLAIGGVREGFLICGNIYDYHKTNLKIKFPQSYMRGRSLIGY